MSAPTPPPTIIFLTKTLIGQGRVGQVTPHAAGAAELCTTHAGAAGGGNQNEGVKPSERSPAPFYPCLYRIQGLWLPVYETAEIPRR